MNPDWRDKLNEIAQELEEEAARMDWEGAAKGGSQR
jgi:hypothetical protein